MGLRTEEKYSYRRAIVSLQGQMAEVLSGGRTWLKNFAAGLLFVLFVFAPAGRAAETFTSVARLTYDVSFSSTAQVTVLKIIPTASALTLLQYAPSLVDAEMIQVPQTAFSGDGSGTAGLPMGAIYPSGSSTPIDLSGPVPLVDAQVFHQGDPLFIRLVDGDQNRFDDLVETIWVLTFSQATGDTELLLLSETAADSGIFVGYIQTSGDRIQVSQNGVLDVTGEDTITVTYSDASDDADVSVSMGLVDPLGIVFDSRTGAAVDGVSLTLINAATGQPAAVYGDDGVSPFPSTIVTGSTVTDDAGKLYVFGTGRFRFPFVYPGTYRMVIEPPAGYAAPSAVADADLLDLPGGSYVVVTPGSRGEDFILNLGPALRMDIPVDPITQGLWVRKTANRSQAAIGDFLQYTVSLERTVDAPDSRITLFDRLPVGFRYRSGSARIDGKTVADPVVSADGRGLTFNLGDLNGESQAQVKYVAEVGAGTPLGPAENTARAQGTGGLISNTTTATVLVSEDLFRSKNFIVGRVIVNNCGDRPVTAEDGLADVRIYMEDGTYTITDDQGRFHFAGISSGTHVIQLDVDSLAEKYEIYPCEANTRFSGNPFSQFVDLQGGTLWRTDFHLVLKPKATGSVNLTLNCRLTGEQQVEFTAIVDGATVPVRNLDLVVDLAPGIHYQAGSTRLDDAAWGEPAVSEQTLRFSLKDQEAGFNHQLVFSAALDPADATADLETQARLTFDTPEVLGQSTPTATTIVHRNYAESRVRQPNLVLRTNFDVMETDLDVDQKKTIDPVLQGADGADVVHVIVKGYSDNLPINERSRHVYVDNFDLSRARAQTVVEHLTRQLGLTTDQVTMLGMGPDEPVADNDTDQGRAANRRVVVDIIREKTVVSQELSVSQEADLVQTPTTGLRPGEQWPEKPVDGQNGATSSAPVRQADGILAPADRALLVAPIAPVRIQLDSRLKPRLFLDDEPVPADKIGFRAADPDTGVTLYTYIGVDFGAPGEHRLTLKGLGPFGNARFTQTHTVIRTGEITAIRQRSLGDDGNVADGLTPVMVAVDLFDAENRPIKAPVALELFEGNLKPAAPADPTNGLTTVVDDRVFADKDGRIAFQPVSQSGRYRATLSYNGRTATVETYVKPKLRDWILVGVAEGTMGYNTLSGNVENSDAAEMDEDLYLDGRLAFFAKGRIKGSWLLTMAYDSEGEKEDGDRRLFQTVDPDAFYTLYGDAAEQQHEAPSLRRLYFKIERERFYAMFGDYNTDLTVTELSRYNRSFNGLKTEYNGDRVDVTAFAADTHQAFIKDEIRGDGTSGLYYLSRRNLVLNSEKVTLETRDRFHGDLVIETLTMTRYVDYTIDYDVGTLFFKSPVFSRDEDLNPIYIVVDYESEDDGDTGYTYGGRAAVKLLDGHLQAGGTYVHEGPVAADGHLVGLDARADLGYQIEVKAEVAATERKEGGDTVRGQAYLAQLAQNTTTHDLLIFYQEQGDGFGLGQQNGSQSGNRKFGAEVDWRIEEHWTLNSEVFHSEQLSTDKQRLQVSSGLSFRQSDYTLSAGFRLVEDKMADGETERSDQLLAGISKSFFDQRVKLRLNHEQSMAGSNDSEDYPTRTIVGADYQLTSETALFAEHEFTFGPQEMTQSDRLGLKTTPWDGGRLSTSMGREQAEDDGRLFANMGLAQTWRINARWQVDAGADRSQTLSHEGSENTGSNSEDFTALSTGVGYDVGDWSSVARLESRWAEEQEKWGLIAGVAGQIRDDLGLSIAGELFQEHRRNGADSLKGDLKLSAAWRPAHGQWTLLDRLEYKAGQQRDSAGETLAQRIVNNFNANFRPHHRLQLAVQYGAKYVFDTIDGASYIGYTDLNGLETRFDITSRWDVGLHVNLLHAWQAGQVDYRTGVSVGYALFKNAWVSVGYNFHGFQDEDFSAADYTAAGPFVKFRLKMDQQTVKDLVSWFDRSQQR